jgi:hypothetical protein
LPCSFAFLPPCAFIIQNAMCVTLVLLQGWLSPVRPGEHYLATYISLNVFSPRKICFFL